MFCWDISHPASNWDCASLCSGIYMNHPSDKHPLCQPVSYSVAPGEERSEALQARLPYWGRTGPFNPIATELQGTLVSNAWLKTGRGKVPVLQRHWAPQWISEGLASSEPRFYVLVLFLNGRSISEYKSIAHSALQAQILMLVITDHSLLGDKASSSPTQSHCCWAWTA